ncbi:MAG: YfkD family protein [Sporolactobacillus sp.]
MKTIVSVSLCLAFLFVNGFAAQAQSHVKATKTPSSVVDLSKENTYPNPQHNASELVPGSKTKALLKTAKVSIENPKLIKLLNESDIRPSKWSIGYHATIALGEWPLNYASKETAVIWEFKKINDNAADARGSQSGQKISYVQKTQAKVSGGLTAKVPHANEVTQMIMNKAMRATDMPIAFTTIVGGGTKIDRPYSVQPKQIGHLYAFVPAVSEKGTITFGEVFLILSGGQAKLVVQNRIQQGIGALMPVQERVFLRYSAQ